MYELIQITGSCYYIQSPAKIGLIKLSDNEVCLIDSGNDKDAGRKVRQILDANNWTLKAIFNTHSNADHIGGNKYLQAQTGCEIYAPEIECCFTNHTILEPTFLYGGFPPKDLRHKFLMAEKSVALPLDGAVLPNDMKMIPLPGHFFDMVGFETSDNVVYLADALSSKATLDKYKISFIYDVEKYLKTLENIKNMTAKLFVPSHADVTDNIIPLAQYNIDKVMEIAEKISDICSEPISFENILSRLFTEFDLKMTIEQHALVGSTVRSYLGWLYDSKVLDMIIENNILLWKR